ncbi:hypothetical protein GQ53DRAFT_125551 [Thozetella sp. PMI_491]|nr:hypothetical protein GQ53DRAFT_125551 [Thozetella sp. PMI_491]
MAFNRVYTSSPVLAMPAQSAFQVPFDRPVLQHQTSSFSQSFSWQQPQQQQHNRTSSLAGRKRSRDEAAVNLDPPEKTVEPPVVIQEDEDEWVYGPGMTLIKKSTGYVTEAASQSGTWVEERAAEEESRKTEDALLTQQQERPSLRSNKSQRLDMSSAQLPISEGHASNRSSPVRDIASASSDALPHPIVDDFTMHLGIGWSRISDSEHIQAAARGWARYIENHFPVNDTKILLESRGLQSYLVEASEGFFLFGENLRQGRLVSRDAERALQNLKSSPPLFDSDNTMEAAESPRPLDAFPEVMATTAAAPAAAPAVAPLVDMDMS